MQSLLCSANAFTTYSSFSYCPCWTMWLLVTASVVRWGMSIMHCAPLNIFTIWIWCRGWMLRANITWQQFELRSTNFEMNSAKYNKFGICLKLIQGQIGTIWKVNLCQVFTIVQCWNSMENIGDVLIENAFHLEHHWHIYNTNWYVVGVLGLKYRKQSIELIGFNPKPLERHIDLVVDTV